MISNISNVNSVRNTRFLKEISVKSALKQNDLYLNNYLNNANVLNMYFNTLNTNKSLSILAKHYQKHDLFNLFYNDSVEFDNKQDVWTKFLKGFAKSEEFLKIHKITENSEELSSLATAKILIKMIEEAKKKMDRQKMQQYFQKGPNINNAGMQQLQEDLKLSASEMKKIAKEVSEEMRGQLEEYKDMKEEAYSATSRLTGGSGFTNEAISLLSFIKNPDETRRRVRILKNTILMFKNFSNTLPPSFKKSQISNDYGEISGIDKMAKETQINKLTTSEMSYLALNNNTAKLLFSLRFSQKDLLIYKGSSNPTISLYVDKSGSMDSTFDNVEKISLASGLALAMFKKYENTRLFLFDTETEEIKDKSKIVQYLLTIRADGGTNITNVLETIKENDKNGRVHIILTDGIDEVSTDTIKGLNNIRQRIAFILLDVNPPKWMENFRYFKVKDIASFTNAVKKSMEVV